jgi:hypothetical protein
MIVGQAVAQSPQRVVGAVKTINAAAREFALALDDGSERRVVLAPDASVVRIAPGEKDLSKAAPIAVTDVQVGDRLLIRGNGGAAGELVASRVVVMSKTDIARKHEADRDEWRRRGLSGRVVAVTPDSGEINVMTNGRMAEEVTLRLAPNAQQRRYRPDSPRFTDAVPSTIAEIKAGDQIHALGDRDPQGVLVAEQIVTGSFRNFAALVTAVDPEQGTIAVKDVDGKKPIMVHVGPDSLLRKLTPEAAQRMANGRPGTGMHGAPGQGHAMPTGARPAGATPGGTMPPAPGQEPGRQPMRIQALLERMPAFTLQDIKPGDALIICTAANAAADKTSAFTILAGAEPLLERPVETQRELLGSWNLNAEPNLP